MAYSQELRPATTEHKRSRRSFLKLGALAVTAGLVPLPVFARTGGQTSATPGRREASKTRGRQKEAVARRGGSAPRSRRGEVVARARRQEKSGRTRRQESPVDTRHEDASLYIQREERSAYVRREEPPAYLYSAARPEKSLAIYNPNTGEGVKTVYWFRGKYLPTALQDIDHLLRDYRANEVKPIDPQLLDLLYSMSTLLETDEPFYVISGYRSPSTNAWLRLFNRAVAENSMHMEGKAVDLRLPGHDTSLVRRAAVALQGGGVGYYPYANFVHVDTGPVRYW